MSEIDWSKVRELRQIFCDDGRAADRSVDYWQEDPEKLRSYHCSLAERIGWKWDSVLGELDQRGFRPSVKKLVDFGCGTGVQTLRVLRWLQNWQAVLPEVVLIDQSPAALKFTTLELRRVFSDLRIESRASLSRVQDVDLMICSHVINEISESDCSLFTDFLRQSQNFIWVEAGSQQSSKQLSHVRERLAADFHWLAPCPHQGSCPTLGSDRDWCHFFAAPPSEAFTSAFWRQFAKVCEIDLRSLPTAYLVGEKAERSAVNKRRMLGRARNHKAGVRVQLCAVDGLQDVVIQKKEYKQLVKEIKKSPFCIELS